MVRIHFPPAGRSSANLIFGDEFELSVPPLSDPSGTVPSRADL